MFIKCMFLFHLDLMSSYRFEKDRGIIKFVFIHGNLAISQYLNTYYIIPNRKFSCFVCHPRCWDKLKNVYFSLIFIYRSNHQVDTEICFP